MSTRASASLALVHPTSALTFVTQKLGFEVLTTGHSTKIVQWTTTWLVQYSSFHYVVQWTARWLVQCRSFH